MAAGVSLPTANIAACRERVNQFYRSLQLADQAALLLPIADVVIDDFTEVTDGLIGQLSSLEPFGSGNPEPILKIENVVVTEQRRMGADNQHLKLEVKDRLGHRLQVLAFSAPASFFAVEGEMVTILFQPTVNEWRGRRSVEGRLLHVQAG